MRPRLYETLVHPDDRDLVTGHLTKLAGLPDGVVEDIEFRVKQKNGEWGWLSCRDVVFARTPDGAVSRILSSCSDITGKKQVGTALLEQEKQYQAVFENTGTAMVLLEKDGTITLANTQFEKLCGFSKQEIEGQRKWMEFVVPQDLKKMEFQHSLRRDDPDAALKQYFFRFNGPGGEIKQISLTIDMVPGTTQSVASLLDITELKKMEEELKKSEQKYRSVVENIQDVFYRTDRDGRLVLLSPSFAQVLAYDPGDEWFGLEVAENFYYTPGERAALLAALEKTGRVDNYEVVLKRKDGNPVTVATKSHYYYTPDGAFAGIEGVFWDITERKHVNEIIVRNEALLRFLADSGLFGMVFRTIDGTITDANDTFLSMVGYSRDELKEGMLNGFALTAPEFRDVDEESFSELISRGINKRAVEKEYIRKDGSRIPVIQAGAMLDEKRSQGVAIIIDNTDRKRAEEALRQANRKLTLLGSITRHDILNQVSVINGFLSLAENECTDPGMEEYFGILRTAAETIQSHIEFTRMYQNIGTKDPFWQDLSFVLDAASKPDHVGFTLETDGIEVFADLMFEKVLYNLLDNAVRHGDHVSSITVRTRSSATGLTICFEDNGIGVPLKEKEAIFERGYGKNTGLGLYLSREILAITGISIQETGTYGKGARFEISVPSGNWRQILS